MRMYVSTRGDGKELTAARAIIKGLADDKGLFVPKAIPSLKDIDLSFEGLADLPYNEVAKKTIGAFFDDFTEDEISYCVDNAYTPEKFSKSEIVPVVNLSERSSKTADDAKMRSENNPDSAIKSAYFLELYHGRTSAFKDMALSILPYLLTTSVKKEGEESKICILTATSGDTGKAALAGFSDVPGTEIIVFYPDGGVSEVQRAQMITQEGANTHVFAIKGNFDDAQTGVKKIFNDEKFADTLADKGVKLSSANSINIGRLIPQVAYYVYGYGRLIKQGAIKAGDAINVVVPTGNFGNILAAYYAHLMGIPVNKFICASNKNKVLTDFINTGVYDARRDFYLTNSPSMDILISSNLERLLYHLACDEIASDVHANEKNDARNAAGDEIKELMSELDNQKHYEVSDAIKNGLKKFYGGFATVEETNDTIGRVYEDCKYLVDTHTAVAYKVYENYLAETGDHTPTLIASTASPFKFAKSVAESIGIKGCVDDFEFVRELSKNTGVEIPTGLCDLDKKEVRHRDVIEIGDMEGAVLGSL